MSKRTVTPRNRSSRRRKKDAAGRRIAARDESVETVLRQRIARYPRSSSAALRADGRPDRGRGPRRFAAATLAVRKLTDAGFGVGIGWTE